MSNQKKALIGECGKASVVFDLLRLMAEKAGRLTLGEMNRLWKQQTSISERR